MRSGWVALAFVVAAGAAPPKLLAAEPRVRVALAGFSVGDGVGDKTGAMVEELLLNALHRTRRIDVVGRSDIAGLIGFERQKQLAGCAGEMACAAEIAGALGVRYLGNASVGRLGQAIVVSFKIIEVATARVLVRTEGRAASDDALSAAIDGVAADAVAGCESEGCVREPQGPAQAASPAGPAAIAASAPPPTPAPAPSLPQSPPAARTANASPEARDPALPPGPPLVSDKDKSVRNARGVIANAPSPAPADAPTGLLGDLARLVDAAPSPAQADAAGARDDEGDLVSADETSDPDASGVASHDEAVPAPAASAVPDWTADTRPEPVPRPAPRWRTLAWTLVVLGLAATAGASFLGLQARSITDADHITGGEAGFHSITQVEADREGKLGTAANVLFGVGAAAGLAGGIVFTVD